MNLSLEKLRKYGFNRRELTETDFYRICEKHGITVLEMNVSNSFYIEVDCAAYIVIANRLKGIKRLFAMFHELAHFLLHSGRAAEKAFFFDLISNRNEAEADALALIALIPKHKIGCFSFLEDHPNRFAQKLWRDRQRLNFLYGI